MTDTRYSPPKGYRTLLLLAIVLAIVGCATTSAQTPVSPFGQRFLVAFPDTVRNLAPLGSYVAVKPASQIIIYSFDTAHVTVRGPGFDATVTVNPSESKVVEPPLLYVDRPGAVSANVFEVTSDRDVALYCYYVTPAGSEAFTPLPVAGWDYQYSVMALRQDSLTDVTYFGVSEEYFQQKGAPPQVVIIASQKTNVTITLPVRMGGGTIVFSLRAGEAYLYEPTLNLKDSSDISGAVITSDWPVGVISGNTRTWCSGYYGTRASIENMVKNSAVEWMPPRDDYGTDFVYHTVLPLEPWRTNEIVRVYPLADSTLVTDTTNHIRFLVRRGGFAQFVPGAPSHPVGSFEIRTNKPAQAMVVSGSYARQSDTAATVDYTYIGWPTSMSELVPHERWITYGRFHSPKTPQYLTHYVIINADATSDVLLDGAPVVFDSISPPGFRYRQARATVAPGDHSIISRNGGFTAIAFGLATGAVEYRPLGTKKDAPAIQMHPSTFSERIGVGYAYPVTGLTKSIFDSLEISSEIFCDSVVVLVKRAQGDVTVSKLEARLDSGSRNVDAVITPTIEFGQTTGFLIRFAPADSLSPASGTVTVTNAAGRRWVIPYSFQPTILTVTPGLVEIINAPLNVEQIRFVSLVDVTSPAPVPFTLRLKHGTAFTLPDSSVFAAALAGGDSLAIRVAFTGVEEGRSYTDTLYITTPCRTYIVVLNAQIVPPFPQPRITGNDWGEQWVTTLNGCTKNTADRYDGFIWIYNDGAAPYKVLRIDLIGADADSGYFSLGTLPGVQPGEEVTREIPRQQRVFFRPKDERTYHCQVRLITDGGDTLTADLLGEGVESHVTVGGADFGTSLFQGVGVTVALRSVTLYALPTRELTVMGLRISGPDANDFDFAPGYDPPDPARSSTWLHLMPGDSFVVPLSFSPRTTGRRNATIEVLGDHSTCDDSTNALTGLTYVPGTPAVDGVGYGYGQVFTCADSLGYATIKNIGGIPIIVHQVTLADPSGYYTLGAIDTPFTLSFDEIWKVPVTFSPRAAGVFIATVTFQWSGVDDTTNIRTLTVALAGQGFAPGSVRASIPRTYITTPGGSLGVVVSLDDALDLVQTRELEFSIASRNRIMLMSPITPGLIDSMLAGTLFEGWTATVQPAGADTLRLLLRAPAGAYLRGTGPLLTLPYRVFLGDTDRAELPFTLRMLDRECAAIITSPGLARVDSVCGLRLRLIELVGKLTSLDRATPNPFNPSTEIGFQLGLDGDVRLMVYDGSGREVDRLVDGYLRAGSYLVRWDGASRPSGVYYYRLVSGESSFTRWMLLVK